MRKLNIFLIIILTSICLISCYIDSDEVKSDTVKSAITINIPLSEEIMKAPANTYYFTVKIYNDAGLAYDKEYVVGYSDVLDLSGNGGIFPIIITDLEPGTYTSLDLGYFDNTGSQALYGYYETPFIITEGENTAINLTMGGV